jgi:hypothetical protein
MHCDRSPKGGENMDKLKELTQYADLDESEVGEVCGTLIYLYSTKDYLSPEFIRALDKEIEAQLRSFQERSKVIEVEETHTELVRKLIWD